MSYVICILIGLSPLLWVMWRIRRIRQRKR